MMENMNSPSFPLSLAVPSLLLGAMTLLPAMVNGQSVIYANDGKSASDNMSWDAGGTGDVDGDGTLDYLVSALFYDLDPDGTPSSGDEASNVGRLYLYSGANGTLLLTIDGENANDQLGNSMSGADDLNGDGVPDILAGAPGYDVDPDGTPSTGDEAFSAGRTYAFSGTDGAVLWTFDGEIKSDGMGRSVSNISDVDLDGYGDVVTDSAGFDLDPDGTPSSGDEVSGAGRVYVLSGATGSTVWTRDGENKSDGLGKAHLARVGDLDLDGIDDVVATATGYDLDPDGTPSTGDEVSSAGRVYVFSGATGSTVWIRDGENRFDQLGNDSMGDVGDVNADIYSDVLACSKGFDFDPDGTPSTGDEVTDVGRLYVLSGKDGSTLWTYNGENAGDQLGNSAVSFGDANGDFISDIVVGAGGWDLDLLGPDGTGGGVLTNTGDEKHGNGRMYVLSGKDSSLIYTVEGKQGGTKFDPPSGFYFGSGERLGNTLDAVGDINGDGIGDILAGAGGWADFSDPGRAGPDGTVGTLDDLGSHGRAYVISGAPMPLTADKHLLSVGVANSQTMTIDAGVGNATKNYWLFTGFAASGDTPGVTMAPGVVIPLNQPDPLTSFVIGLTQLGGGAPTFAGWKSTLDGAGKASPSLNTFGPTPAPIGITLHHAALVYTADGCGVGCDTFQLATNWVPMTTTP